MEPFNDQDMKDLAARHKLKKVPDAIMKDYLAGVRGKIHAEKMRGFGGGIPVWIGVIAVGYAAAFAFAFGVYWVEGRPDFSNPVVQIQEEEAAMLMSQPEPLPVPKKERPSPSDIKIESDAELLAILTALGEDANILDDQQLFVEVERLDSLEISAPAARV